MEEEWCIDLWTVIWNSTAVSYVTYEGERRCIVHVQHRRYHGCTRGIVSALDHHTVA